MSVDLLDRFLAQVGLLQTVWMPFLLLWLAGVIGTGVVIRRAMEWRYGGTIERLKDECEALRKQAKAKRPGKATPVPAAPAAAIPAIYAEPEPEIIDPEDRLFVGKSITAESLIDLHRGHTDAQARKLIAPFIGQWIKVVTSVHNVYPLDGANHVCGNVSELPSRTVWLKFSKSEFPRVETLTLGEKISVVGRIKNVGKFDLDLTMCEFVD